MQANFKPVEYGFGLDDVLWKVESLYYGISQEDKRMESFHRQTAFKTCQRSNGIESPSLGTINKCISDLFSL